MDIDIREDREEPQDGALLELASMIDEDRPIDWDSEEIEARGAAERAVLAELRLLAALARVIAIPTRSVARVLSRPRSSPWSTPTACRLHGER